MRELLIENGVWGVALLMLLQNILPILPSEVIMPLAGFLSSLGILPMEGVVVAGVLGSIAGHLPWYFLGYSLGEEKLERFVDKHGHWILLRRAHVHKAGEWFDRNSAKAVFLGRLVPGLRTCVNIPAGTTRMAFIPYLAYTLLGDALWIGFLGYGGYVMGRDYSLISGYLHLFVWSLAAAVLVFAGWMYVRHHRRVDRPSRIGGKPPFFSGHFLAGTGLARPFMPARERDT